MTGRLMKRPCLYVLAVTALCACAGTRPEPVRAQQFDFHNGFWINLHNFLYVSGRAHEGMDRGREAVQSSLADTVGFGALSATERATWLAALQFFRTNVSPLNAVFSDEFITSKNALVQYETRASAPPPSAALSPEHHAHLLAAAPIYEKVWWPRHRTANNAWIASMQPFLREFGDTMATLYAGAFGTTWPAQPVRVDVAAYSNWSGAYTTNRPSHIMFASTNPAMSDTLGFEILFHESGHTLDRLVQNELEALSEEQGRVYDYDAVHTIVFYTAARLTTRLMPSHTGYPDRYGLFRPNGNIGEHYEAVDRYWGPYLRGQTTRTAALRSIAATFKPKA